MADPTQDPTIRSATETDVRAVQRVARAAWHAAYDDLIGPATVDEKVDSWYDPDAVAADVGRDQRPFFVAVAGDRDPDAAPGAAHNANEVVGFVVAAPGDDPALARLYRIYVHPDRWGEGVGTALLDRMEGELRERGFERLRLSVLADNDPAVGFYEARGFERIEETYDEQFESERAVYLKELRTSRKPR